MAQGDSRDSIDETNDTTSCDCESISTKFLQIIHKSKEKIDICISTSEHSIFLTDEIIKKIKENKKDKRK